jgi:hypothetical protein
VQPAALFVVIATGLWLAGVGVLMAVRPGYCIELIERMTIMLEASNWRLNVTEQGLRIVAGAALVVRAPASKLPLTFEVAGWVLVGSSVLIILAPVRWHGAYGRLLVRRLAPRAIRLLSPVAVPAGAGLIYAAL